jgi:plastocyanin
MAVAQVQDVTGSVQITRAKAGAKGSDANVVVWLVPSDGVKTALHPSTSLKLVQKNKSFSPHVLVVQVGSSVEFPNQDPFFHNVFSLFNGKRFDLGLYESGSTRSVHFDHEGVSYIFCNIHPEMGAVIVALSTPYYAVSGPDGKVTVRGVPDGDYDLHVWAESADEQELKALTRRVQVAPANHTLGVIQLTETTQNSGHKNKFGEEYPPATQPTYSVPADH